LPRVRALGQLRNGGFTDRIRSNPWLAVAIAGGCVLFLAWIAWAIYVASSQGVTAGLGVVIAWPALLGALMLIALPFIGGYLLVRRLSSEQGATAAVGAEAHDEPEDEVDDEDEDEVDEEESETEAAAG
jgi:hypothetical protein